MPIDITFPSSGGHPDRTRRVFPVATEQELLDFCNKGREAGGANILEALLLSDVGNATTCLIANALNFGCHIVPSGASSADDDARYDWYMNLPRFADHERIQAIAAALDVPVYRPQTRYQEARLGPLPAHIGNAADAFDEELAFTDFIRA